MSKEQNNEELSQEGAAGGKDANADIYENRGTKKIVRLVTVMAYMFSVSFVAIVLSAYYLFLWEPPNPRLLRRPVQFSSEPEIQFLLSDQMTLQDEPNESQEDSNTSRISFSVRTDDNYDYEKKRREKLNESLFLLRNSLVEFLQNRMNDSKSFDRDFSRGNWTTSESLNRTSSETDKWSGSTGKSGEKDTKHSSKIISRIFDDNGTSLTLESSTISGNEANNDRFPSTRKYSVYESFENVFQLNRGLTKNVADEEQYKKNTPTNFITKDAATGNEKDIKIEVPQYSKVRSSNEGSINTTRIIMSRNDRDSLDILNNREDRGYNIENMKQVIHMNNQSTINSSRNLEFAEHLKYSVQSNQSLAKLANVAIKFRGDERKDKLYEPKHKQKLVRVLTVVAYVIFVSMAAILLSLYYTFLWDPKDVPVRMRMKPECANIKSSNPLTAPSIVNETQIEKMTTKSVTVANEQSPSPQVVTTQQQKDLLTILTKIANISSSASPLATSEDLQTDSSIETKEASIKINDKIN